VTSTKKRARPRSTLVYVEDRGAVYDAPIDVVWDFFLRDEEFHSKAHRVVVRNFHAKRLSKLTTLISYERRQGRGWVKLSCRMTTIPPAIRVQEDLDGPYAGSIKLFLYAPRGRRTVVDVLAYMRSDKFTPKQIKANMLRDFARAYRDDLPWFRKYVRSVKGK